MTQSRRKLCKVVGQVNNSGKSEVLVSSVVIHDAYLLGFVTRTTSGGSGGGHRGFGGYLSNVAVV